MTDRSHGLGRLTALVATLRSPEGCPWDREQRLTDLRAYLLEEAHEVAAAIDGGVDEELAEELGDLVFLIAFVARLAEEQGAFTLTEVIAAAEAKIVARHPHVFGGDKLADADAVRKEWEARKLRGHGAERSLLAGVQDSLPALLAAYRMTQKAAAVGFDWPDPAAVLDKVKEEVEELRQAIADGDRKALEEEAGDLLFTVANLARSLRIDPESALARANRKFRRRFEAIENGLRERGKSLEQAETAEMEELWQRAKRRGRAASD